MVKTLKCTIENYKYLHRPTYVKMKDKVFFYLPFIPNGGTRALDASDAIRLYKDIRGHIPDCVALYGSRVYGKPRKSSDLDVIEIYDGGRVVYEHQESDGVEISILKAPRSEIELDIESDIYGNYLTTKFCRINKPLKGEKDIFDFEDQAMKKLLIEGLKKKRDINDVFITPSYGMKLITTMRMWYEPQRWWSIYSSLFNCSGKERNIAIFYDKVVRAMEHIDNLTEVESHNGEKVFSVEGINREAPKIKCWISGLYSFAKAQFSAADLKHIFKELYPKIYGVNMALFHGSLRYPELFMFNEGYYIKWY